jgi:hypothetical protein
MTCQLIMQHATGFGSLMYLLQSERFTCIPTRDGTNGLLAGHTSTDRKGPLALQIAMSEHAMSSPFVFLSCSKSLLEVPKKYLNGCIGGFAPRWAWNLVVGCASVSSHSAARGRTTVMHVIANLMASYSSEKQYQVCISYVLHQATVGNKCMHRQHQLGKGDERKVSLLVFALMLCLDYVIFIF